MTIMEITKKNKNKRQGKEREKETKERERELREGNGEGCGGCKVKGNRDSRMEKCLNLMDVYNEKR